MCVCVCFEFGIFGPVSNRSLDRLVQFPCRSELGGLCSNSWDISLMAWMFYCLATSIYASKMKYLWNCRFFFPGSWWSCQTWKLIIWILMNRLLGLISWSSQRSLCTDYFVLFSSWHGIGSCFSLPFPSHAMLQCCKYYFSLLCTVDHEDDIEDLKYVIHRQAWN